MTSFTLKGNHCKLPRALTDRGLAVTPFTKLRAPYVPHNIANIPQEALPCEQAEERREQRKHARGSAPSSRQRRCARAAHARRGVPLARGAVRDGHSSRHSSLDSIAARSPAPIVGGGRGDAAPMPMALSTERGVEA